METANFISQVNEEIDQSSPIPLNGKGQPSLNSSGLNDYAIHEHYNTHMIYRLAGRYCNFRSTLEQRAIDKFVKVGLVPSAAAATLEFKRLDGLSNITFKVTDTSKQYLPTPVTFKWYKNTFSMFVNRDLEAEIVNVLAAKGDHPRVLHYDSECRIQDFVEGVSLASTHISEQTLLSVTEKLSLFARNYNLKNLSLVSRDFQSIVKKARSIYSNIQKKHPKALLVSTKQHIFRVLGETVTSKIQRLVPLEMVLSHNDANMTNCIIGPDGKLTLLDFEFSGLNYLGFEIGNMLNEVATDYANTFEIKPQWELKEPLKRAIMDKYFSTLCLSMDHTSQSHLVEVGRLLSHYFWMIIGLQSFQDAECQLDLNYYITRRIEYIDKYLSQLHI